MQKVDLSSFSNTEFCHGAAMWKRVLWMLVNPLLVQNPYVVSSGFKKAILCSFGARIGKGVVIKQGIRIKYPWRLQIGDYSWIGENVWIDNLVPVSIGNHCCLSQGAMLLTGNHDYKSTSFDLVVGEIRLGDGVWIGAKSIVCPGVVCDTHAVLSVGSVAVNNLEKDTVYQGNPAVKKRSRW